MRPNHNRPAPMRRTSIEPTLTRLTLTWNLPRASSVRRPSHRLRPSRRGPSIGFNRSLCPRARSRRYSFLHPRSRRATPRATGALKHGSANASASRAASGSVPASRHAAPQMPDCFSGSQKGLPYVIRFGLGSTGAVSAAGDEAGPRLSDAYSTTLPMPRQPAAPAVPLRQSPEP